MADARHQTSTHCPYCALQCGMHLSLDGDTIAIDGDKKFPVNLGGLCVKGWTAAETLRHPERLSTPLARNRDGHLVSVDWDTALSSIAAAFRNAQQREGADAVGVFGGGSLTNEKAYLLGKFARVAVGTANVDYNGRFCMSSAAAGASRSLGIDRGLPFPLEDIPRAKTILLVGANIAETMPPLMRYFEEQQRNGGRLIVADPRRTATAQWAQMHVRLRPGSDVALANGLLHVMVRDGLIDEEYIAARTERFDAVRHRVAAYWPGRVESIAGVPESDVVAAARLLGTSETAMILTARGAEQHAHGVDTVSAFINIALSLGLVGRRFSGFGSLTGQGNGQGGREHGQKADQLPGYRHIEDPAARRHIARVWRIPERDIPRKGKSAYELFDSCGQPHGVRALFITGSNPVVSAPNALHVADRLRALDFLAVSDFFLSETAALADIVLPAAQWAEEDGTITNLEGRVIHRRRAVAPPQGIRSDIDILCGLARHLGGTEGFSFADAAGVFEELREATAGGAADYSGITYDRIDNEDGVFWPCPSIDHPGTPRLFTESFPTPSGRAVFVDVEDQDAAETPDDTYPLYLTTGRALSQYQSGTQTRRIPALCETARAPVAEVHPFQAKRHALRDGGMVTLRTRRGSARFVVKVTPEIRQDTVFVPFHWGDEGSANRLTNAALDPISKMPEFKACAVRIEGS